MYLLWQSHGQLKSYDLAQAKIRKKINKDVGYAMRLAGMDDKKFKAAPIFADAHFAIYYKIGKCATFERFEIVREL